MEFPRRQELTELVPRADHPTLASVRYEPETRTCPHPAQRARKTLATLEWDTLEPGATVAVGVGSRGITDIESITAATVAAIRDRDLEPVIVPAMGSHGGATADGQRELLASLGITDEIAPIDARMDVTQVAEVAVGETTAPVYVADAALEADGVVVLNRVKPHTNFTGRIESGCAKMVAVGLGKQRGASAFHATALREGYVPTIETFYDAISDETPLLGGLAIVENFEEAVAQIASLPADAVLEREPALLETARDAMPTLPVDDLDLLVVDEVGKDISGAGMDTNVIGRYRVINAPDPERPDIDVIYARGLSEGTKGNGNGIGLADLTRQAAVDDLDVRQTYANALTSGSLEKAKLPPVVPDDEVAFDVALTALGGPAPDDLRLAWIENTSELTTVHVSVALLDELPDTATIEGRVDLTFENGEARFKSV